MDKYVYFYAGDNAIGYLTYVNLAYLFASALLIVVLCRRWFNEFWIKTMLPHARSAARSHDTNMNGMHWSSVKEFDRVGMYYFLKDQ